jgi:hypothetical protein
MLKNAMGKADVSICMQFKELSIDGGARVAALLWLHVLAKRQFQAAP